MRIAIGIHFAVHATRLDVSTERLHLLVGLNGRVGLVFFAIQNGKPLKEDGAVVAFALGIGAVCLDRGGKHALQRLFCIGITAQGVVQQRLVEDQLF